MNNKMKPITQSCLLFIWLHALNVVRAEESGDVRLVGGTSHCNGVLEMKHQREWRPVHRGPFWTGASSAVVCRQLQCGTASSTEIQRVDSRQSTWNIRDQCVGSESSLRECGILVDFKSSYIIKVICAESVRLVNNLRLVHSEHVGSLCSGRVEVKSEQSWLSVCEGDFDQQDAEVVCRELGCGPPSVLQGALYGEVKAPMWTKEFQCDGSESALLDCRTSDSTRNTCSPDKTVGLTCSESNDVRLVAGTSHCNGKLEMKYLGEWREVDDWSWNQKSSAVACRQLSCGSVEAAERFRAPSSEIRWWIESSCDGSESSLWECVERERHNNSYIISTYSGHQVGLTCSDLFKPNITTLPAAGAAGV